MLPVAILLFLFWLPTLASGFLNSHSDIFWYAENILVITITLFTLLLITARLKKYWLTTSRIVLLLPLLVIEIMRAISYYLQGQSFNDRFFFHLSLKTIETSWSNYPILPWLILILLFLFLFLIITIGKTPYFIHKKKHFCLVFLLFTIVLNIFYPSAVHEFIHYQIIKSRESDQHFSLELIASSGLNTKAIFPDPGFQAKGQKYNLVLIYMEGLESIYSDPQVFPDLTPNLNTLRQNNLWFSNMEQTQGASWTIAGMVASLCGTPLLYQGNAHGQDILTQGFLQKAICLPDILAKAGYHQVFMGGAQHEFAGKGAFLKTHHYHQVYGLNELKPQLEDPSYLNDWGLFDDSLFDLAAQKFVQLSRQNQPFNLTLLTIDTHHPKGYQSKSCKAYPHSKDQILNAVHCTDQLIQRFLDKLSTNPKWQQTLVVLVSDHLGMRNTAQKYFPADYQRTLNFIVLNQHLKNRHFLTATQLNVLGRHVDIAPTILDLLEIDHNVSFLAGSSLLSPRKHPRTDFSSKKTIDTIKYVNSHYLSHVNSDPLCPSNSLSLTFNHSQLLINQKSYPLHYDGVPINLETLRDKNLTTDLGIRIVVDNNFLIKEVAVLKTAILPQLDQHTNFLLVVHNTSAEEAFFELYWGQGQNLHKLHQWQHLTQLDFAITNCQQQLQPIKNSNGFSLELVGNLKNACRQYKQPQMVYRDKQIFLSHVNIGNEVYQVTLKRRKDKLYLQGYTKQENSIPAHCMAIVHNQKLYLPMLWIAENKHSIYLDIVDSEKIIVKIPQQYLHLFEKAVSQ